FAAAFAFIRRGVFLERRRVSPQTPPCFDGNAAVFFCGACGFSGDAFGHSLVASQCRGFALLISIIIGGDAFS
ncbi:MAG: hypothetical protein UHL07_08800, partial [Bacteroidaceae bacterium]|nr:hypothetical protein [Bacteroidaceae bacterium]